MFKRLSKTFENEKVTLGIEVEKVPGFLTHTKDDSKL